MTYSVKLTGGYRSQTEASVVDIAMGQLFKQDPARVRQLIASRATIKRGVDFPTAERYRGAIEQAGALCSIEDEANALSIDEPAPAAPPVVKVATEQTDAPEAETVLHELSPSLKAYAGSILFGLLLLPAFGLGLLILIAVFVKWKSTHYKLTDQRLFVRTGLISRKLEEIQLYRVKDVTFAQGILDRLLSIGAVTVFSADTTAPKVTLIGIENPEAFKEAIRSAYRKARQREGVRAAERILD